MPVLPDARCLDLFAGSGALGFEALSRGASRCVLVENNPEAVRYLQASAALLGATGAELVCAEALRWIDETSRQFDIVFLDPPFADSDLLIIDIAEILKRRRLLALQGWIYLEQSRDRPLPALPGLELNREQCAGQVRASLWRSAAIEAD